MNAPLFGVSRNAKTTAPTDFLIPLEEEVWKLAAFL